MLASIDTTPDEGTILDIFRYCQQQFSRHGVRLTFPPGTEPCKTYKWRYLEGFVKQMCEWGISIQTAYEIIDSLVSHAATNRQLHRGLAVLASASMMNIAYRSLSGKEQDKTDIYQLVKSNLDFLNSIDLCDRYQTLLASEGCKSPNIVLWYMQGKLSTTFISLSRSCQMAINKLSDLDRSLMPNKLALEQARRICIAKVDLKYRLKLLLGIDWGVIC